MCLRQGSCYGAINRMIMQLRQLFWFLGLSLSTYVVVLYELELELREPHDLTRMFCK